MIDLHAHTDRSDGSTDAAELVRFAVSEGIEALGIADHDTLAGYDAALPAAAESGLELVCAVELSTRPSEPKEEGKRQPSVHLLGYWLLSPPSAEFRCWLESQQESRRRRNLELVAKLEQLGVPVSLDEAEVYGRNQVGRPHFARVLRDKGYVSSMQEAFDLYLADEAKASVERDEPTLEKGIQQITESGGIAALAHPVRLPQRGPELASLLERLIDDGLQGLEVFHSEHSPADMAEYGELARRFDLVPTGGSDFHGDNKPHIRLGTGIDSNISLSYSFLENMREMCAARQHRTSDTV
ncbi:MAG TPA: PHP domain-containing protein [Terracidiphilus sp.]|nr:PHP domain-containing protein [Terracidiphilus sp.]